MHEEFVELAIELINENGRNTVFKVPGNITDSDKPWQGSSAALVAIATQKAVYVPISDRKKLGIEFIPESLLKTCNEVLLVAAESADLTPTSMITDTLEFRVAWCYALKPGDTVILYAFGITR